MRGIDFYELLRAVRALTPPYDGIVTALAAAPSGTRLNAIAGELGKEASAVTLAIQKVELSLGVVKRADLRNALSAVWDAAVAHDPNLATQANETRSRSAPAPVPTDADYWIDVVHPDGSSRAEDLTRKRVHPVILGTARLSLARSDVGWWVEAIVPRPWEVLLNGILWDGKPPIRLVPEDTLSTENHTLLFHQRDAVVTHATLQQTHTKLVATDDGAQLAYRLYQGGPGTPVVVLEPPSHSCLDLELEMPWNRVNRKTLCYAVDRPVVRVCTRGCGESTCLEPDMSVRSQVRDIQLLLSHIHETGECSLEKYYLLATRNAAFAALRIAQLNPRAVAGITLEDPWEHGSDFWSLEQAQQLATLVDRASRMFYHNYEESSRSSFNKDLLSRMSLNRS